MKWLLFTLFLFILFSVSAQNKNKLSFEFGYGLSSLAMNDFNKNYIHNSIHDFTGVVFQDDIKKGYHSFLNLKYQPTELFDVGCYGNFQKGSTSAPLKIIFTDDYGRPVDTIHGDLIVTTQAIGVGLTSNWYVSYLLGFHEAESKFLQHFKIATELSAGVGFSKVTGNNKYPDYTLGSSFFQTTSKDFQGQIALKCEYDYVTHPVFASIGFKVGYQYFKTNTLKTSNGQDWIVNGEHSIHLDFSGVFASIYLGVGK